MQLFVNNQPLCEVTSIDVVFKISETEEIKVRRNFQFEGHITIDNAMLSDYFLKYLQDSKKYLANNWRKMHHIPLIRKTTKRKNKGIAN